jgi:hypothetical protein
MRSRSPDETRRLLDQAVARTDEASGGTEGTVDDLEAAFARYGLDMTALVATVTEFAAQIAGPLPYPSGREVIHAKATDLLTGVTVGLELAALLGDCGEVFDDGAYGAQRCGLAIGHEGRHGRSRGGDSIYQMDDVALTALKLDIERELSMRSS